MKPDKNFFTEQKISGDELKKYKDSAKRDLDIAKNSKEPEVVFHFGYMALIKIGIYCLSKAGYRVKSRPGHHQKIIEYLGFALNCEDVNIIGDKMRKDRNLDLYCADHAYSEEELKEYIDFIETVYKKI